ncbi:NTE family protein [Massilia sp. UYP11]|uniref:patatin-like phospholipase family protein n=1 Tax=Massilia sp. UYP11 TaxID=1756385 RepID=UPI003D23D118
MTATTWLRLALIWMLPLALTPAAAGAVADAAAASDTAADTAADAAAGAQPAAPRIGLVLGGGGARGTAHVGVLDVLDALRVPVHCVAGTSMGSLVAGAWLGGLTPPQMLERIGKVDWRDLFDDATARGQTNYRERRLAQSYYPGLEAGITPDGLRMARGLLGGQKIKLFFNTLVGADRGERTIESLPLPLSIVTTDIGTGERVVFRSGELAAAMRASMSVPAVLAPVRYQDRYLVDGGLVDNLPVREARERCQADVIIAVDVGSPLLQPQQVASVATVSLQMINILTEQNAEASRAQLGPGDIYIKPDLTGITAADFGKFREGAARGKAAAEAVAPQLARLALPVADYAAWTARLRSPAPPPPVIDRVEVARLRHVNPVLVHEHLDIVPGQPLDTNRLEAGLARVYGEGDFESVDYALLGTRARRILQVTPTEKSWGPDYLRFGVELQAANDENDFALRMAYHRKWLNPLGGEWLSGAQIGERATLFTQFYQPLGPRQRFFLQPALALVRDRLNVYQDDRRIAEYALRSRGASLGLGMNAGTVGQLRLERTVRKIEATVETGPASLPTGESTLRGWQVVADFDQFDSAFFPSRGWAARAAWFRHDDGDYSRLATELRAAYVWGEYVLNGRLHYTGSTQGRMPLADAAALGGFLNLSGYVRNQVLADDVRFASLRGEKIIGRMPLGLRGDLRVGLSLEAGSARNRFTETRLDGWQAAAAIYLGGTTPLGPLYFGAGLAQGGRSSLYLFIGLP